MNKLPEIAPNGARRICFLLIQTLPTFGAECIWVSRFFFLDFLDPTFLDVQVPRSPNSQISRFPDFQTPPAPDELSDPNLTPLPTHSGIKYVARSPCCDVVKLALQQRGCALEYTILIKGKASGGGDASAQHCTGMTNCPKYHPLGIESFATEGIG